MSVFGNLMSKIFGGNKAPSVATPAAMAGGVATAVKTASAPAASTMPSVDVGAVLEAMAAKNPQKLNWRSSIVDLMKLVGMESSLTERKELAKELGYTGNMEDSAAMNIWLHKQVLKKLAENGGTVPAELLN